MSLLKEKGKNKMSVERPSPKVPKPRRFKLIPFEQLRLGPERNYLVKGLVPRHGVTVFWATSTGATPHTGRKLGTPRAISRGRCRAGSPGARPRSLRCE